MDANNTIPTKRKLLYAHQHKMVRMSFRGLNYIVSAILSRLILFLQNVNPLKQSPDKEKKKLHAW